MEVNGDFVVCRDFGLEFFAKTKPLRPRPRTNITDWKSSIKFTETENAAFVKVFLTVMKSVVSW